MRAPGKAWLLTAFVLIAMLALTACGGGTGNGAGDGGQTAGGDADGGRDAPGAGGDTITIGVAVPDLSISFWTSIAYGISEEAKVQDTKIVMVSAGGDANVDRQISQIQDLMQQQVDALIVGATNGDGVAPVVEAAIAQGIPVVGLSSTPNTDRLVSRVGADHYGMGQLQAQCLGDLLDGNGKVAMMAGPAGQSWADERANGFQEHIAAEFPDIEIVAVDRTNDNRNAATNLMEDWLQRFPDLNGVYTATDDIGAGAADAIQAANKTGQIVVSSSNLSPIGEQYLKDGLIACQTTQQVVLQGREAVRQAYAAATGGAVEANVVTDVIFVNNDNLAQVDFSNVRAPEGYKP